MCGIAGFFNSEKRELSKNILFNFSKTLDHRGPDNSGIYYNKYVGLSHNRLSIIDLSDNGNQPITDGENWLVYNGEIYNYKQLKEDLIKKSFTFSSNSDSEVLFKAIKHYGIASTLNKLEGMFAFAFYNSKSKLIILARDEFGIKPLFYTIRNNTLYFASELKALVKELKFEIDQFRTIYSVFGIAEKSRYETIFKDLYHLPPGTFLTFSKNGLKSIKYFNVSDLIDEKKYNQRKKANFYENLEEFHHLFDKSVRMMLMSDAPMGAFVSGGIDSSLISSYAVKYSKKGFKLFTANVQGKYSEYEDAKLLSKYLDKPLYDYPYKPEFFIRDLAKVTWYYESPLLVHNNAIPFSNIAGIAKDNKVKAVLTGEGADEMFMGYPEFLTRSYDYFIKSPYRLLDSLYGLNPSLNKYIKGGASSGMEAMIEKASQNFTRDLLRNEGLDKLSFLPTKIRQKHYSSIQMLNERLISLLWRNDRMGMMNSIESRFPFLSSELIEFAINLPMNNKIGYINKFYNYKHPFMIDKKIIRYSAQKILPKKLVYKSKKGFPSHGLSDIKVKSDFFFDGFISDLLRLHKPDQLDFFTKNFNNYHISKFAALEIWGKLFIRNESIQKVQSNIDKNIELKNNLL
ncbi:MAG: asparagine synthase (glutamine-hydrolyzing) [Candidatus Marinimicrobia bacterium]|nr:asparagine synthase (glutamine-hydrolyzing) [Candidatus Neomarinimicrobiota bacterium]